MVRRMGLLVGLLVFLAPGIGRVQGQALGGSEASVTRAYDRAEDHGFTFLQTSQQVQRFVEAGYLVRVRSRPDFVLHDVSFPYGRPEVKLFIERLGAQHRRACGEELVVTSLTRPLSEQPRNASTFSVHPTGMAVDFRTSLNSVCRRWLESTLLYLEGMGVLEATRERYPSHFHVAVFPKRTGFPPCRVTWLERVIRSGPSPVVTERPYRSSRPQMISEAAASTRVSF